MRIVAIVRRELRLHDNPLWRGWKDNEIIPVFILDDFNQQEHGDALKALFFEALRQLRQAINKLGGHLYCIHESQQQEFLTLAKPGLVRWCVDWEPHSRTRDEKLQRLLDTMGIRWETYVDSVLVPPSERCFYVYSRYYKSHWTRHVQVGQILPAPLKIRTPKITFREHEIPVGCAKFIAGWSAQEDAVRQTWRRYVEQGLSQYAQRRNYLGDGDSSRMSPYIRCGIISVREIYKDASSISEPYLRELAWRDFHVQLLYHHPELTNQELRPEWRGFPWRRENTLLLAWVQGETGIPIVDAGMRQLLQEGWLPNRVRMIVASFLTKHLLVDWRLGERHFYKHLIDADLAQNVANWQWCAGCGADAAPYFRVFNPVLQARKFDPNGGYIRRYVPELAHVPIPALFQHHDLRFWAPQYKPPMVDLAQAKHQYLNAVRNYFRRGK